MITGNITLSSKPNEEDLRTQGICSSCNEECREVPINESFSDQFGLVTQWGVGSDCCGAEVLDINAEIEE